jgi:hypothetical protein
VDPCGPHCYHRPALRVTSQLPTNVTEVAFISFRSLLEHHYISIMYNYSSYVPFLVTFIGTL